MGHLARKGFSLTSYKLKKYRLNLKISIKVCGTMKKLESVRKTGDIVKLKEFQTFYIFRTWGVATFIKPT